MHQSFINYKTYRYAIFSSLLAGTAVLLYSLDSPRQPANGGTWLGYGLGTLAASIILVLMWYGIRKRSYHSSFGSVSGWLSAHVYLGLALLFIATLHTGFQFGWNIHTLTFVLMTLVILSGCWGAYTYLKYPGLIHDPEHHSEGQGLFQEIQALDQSALQIAQEFDLRIQDIVADAIRRTAVGGNIGAQLRGRDLSKMLIPRKNIDSPADAVLIENQGQQSLIEMLAGLQARSVDPQKIAKLSKLLDIVAKKAILLNKLRRQIQLRGLLRIWLYFHLPLSFSLLAALISHVIVVFLYW